MKSIAVYLTGACNLRCKHCSVGLDQYHPRETLDDAAILHVLGRAAERGVAYVTLLGGEPTYTNHDLGRIAKEATRLGLKLSINTNLFFVEKLLPLLGFSGLANIVVSLDGACEPSHDAMRGKGSFRRTMDNLAILTAERDRSRPDLTIDLTFVLTELNRRDVPEIIELAQSSGANRLNVNLINPVGRGETFRDKLRGGDAYLEAIARLMLYFILRKPSIALSIPLPPVVAAFIEDEFGVPTGPFVNDTACGGTDVYTYVDLKGNLLPCPGLSFEEGRNPEMNRLHQNLDLAQHSIAEIEKTSMFRAFNTARDRLAKNRLFEPCKTCRFRDSCSPCTSSFYKKGAANVIDMCKRVHERLQGDDRLLEYFPFEHAHEPKKEPA